ncbi:MraY family glycosyltransferase [Elongatibacter sediminis]|uniref:MraY family glycosyltransferase n=1 Tax=Elongatibacter sediminis TaxID=3119006 RepID=A0AAW9REL4_9GAMM
MSLLSAQPWILLPMALLMSVVCAALLVPLAQRVNLVDRPDIRKVHDAATPLVGGAAIYVALVISTVLSPIQVGLSDPFYLAVLAGGALLLLTGLIDDWRGLSPLARFLVQIGACLLLIRFTGVRLDDFGPLFTDERLNLGWCAIPITIFAAMGVINALNLCDGMDGLAGSIVCIAAAGMAMFSAIAGDTDMLWLLLLTMATVCGFLLLNARLPWNPVARIFLGDAGSLMLGFVLAWSFIRLGSGPERAFMPMTAVWLFAVPLLDTSTLIWMRWRSGRSAFAADQRHLHHAFLRAGFSMGETWIAITLLAVMLAGVGIVFEFSQVPAYLSFYGFMIFAFAYYFYLRHSWAAQSFLGRHFIHHDFQIEEKLHYGTKGAMHK